MLQKNILSHSGRARHSKMNQLGLNEIFIYIVDLNATCTGKSMKAGCGLNVVDYQLRMVAG